jgi:pyridoxal 5'-phosphate synthase pdxT subunit
VVGKIGVLALQGDVREHSRVLSELGAHPVEVRLPGDLDGLEGLILPGGESTAISLLLESSGVGDPLRKLLAAGLPAFGTCAGMILLASEVLDGRADQCRFGAIDIAVRRNGFGRQVDSFETDLDVPVAGPDPLHAVFIRAPLVERTGPDVEVLASLPPGESSGEGSRRVVACRQGSVLVTSFHPELSGDPRLHQLFLKGC